MANDLFSYPPRAPIGSVRGNDVFLTAAFDDYLKQVYARIGGVTAPSNNEIGDSLALAVFEQRIPKPNNVRGGDGITTTHDAAGPTLSLDAAFVVRLVEAFAHRNTKQPIAPNDAQAVICARVFKH